MITRETIVPGGAERRGRKARLVAYWLSSFTEKHVELGIILVSLDVHGSLLAAALTGLAFQVGKVVAVFVRVPPTPARAGLAVLGGTALLLWDLPALPVCLAGTALLAVATNYTRRWAKAGVGNVERLKNAARVCSIVSAPFFSVPVTAALALIALGVLARHAGHAGLADTRLTATVVGSLRPTHLAMVVHQAHYFSYSHAVPFLFTQVFEAPAAVQGLIFYLGWVGYDVYDFVTVRASSRGFWTGHVIAAIGIVGLFSVTSPLTAALLWTATGIGGGTVVMLSHLGRRDDPDVAWNLEVSEYYGHLGGMAVLVVLSPLMTLSSIGWVAGLLAVLAPLPLAWSGRVIVPARGHRSPVVTTADVPGLDTISACNRRVRGWNIPCHRRPSRSRPRRS